MIYDFFCTTEYTELHGVFFLLLIVIQTIPLSKESKESFDERSELTEAKDLGCIGSSSPLIKGVGGCSISNEN